MGDDEIAAHEGVQFNDLRALRCRAHQQTVGDQIQIRVVFIDLGMGTFFEAVFDGQLVKFENIAGDADLRFAARLGEIDPHERARLRQQHGQPFQRGVGHDVVGAAGGNDAKHVRDGNRVVPSGAS
jgi:hypothetical protein